MSTIIFHKSWWLDSVAQDRWGMAKILQEDEVVAQLPYMRTKRWGQKGLIQPPLTPYMGPWLRTTPGKHSTKLAREKELMTQLVSQLPPCDYFNQRFHYSITNWLPFYWQGFNQTTLYTYVIDNISNPDELWERLAPNIRREIKKARNRYHLMVRCDLGLDILYQIVELTYQRQGQSVPFSKSLLSRIDQSCREHNSSRSFFAVDKNDGVHAVAYIVWDKQSAYYLIGGGDPRFRTSGAASLLIWEAILFSASVCDRFDFEGSMIPGVERFFRAFGATQYPYFKLTRMRTRVQIMKSMADIYKSIGKH
ncbi:GNAT family N-acetyltransferase [bacterium]|nr:GNAT family N-acetyltransferase [bacterium]